jgi:hypothetical protein
MSARRFALVALLAVLAAGTLHAPAATAASAAADSSGTRADATVYYNAGTIALERGDLGGAVTLLAAAARLEPRAPDVRANLLAAASQVARIRGDEEGSARAESLPFPVAAAEAWWMAAVMLALGASLGIAGMARRVRPVVRWSSAGLLLLGIALSGWLHLAEWREARHPEAVVVVPTLSVERGPDEPSRPAILLSAGERVRLGRSRGELVEIRFGGNPIGWAPRAGLWRVIDAPRYTSRFRSG